MTAVQQTGIIVGMTVDPQYLDRAARSLLTALGDLPRLTGRPPCAEAPHLFDACREGEPPPAALARWQAAEEICLDCPLLSRCLPLTRERGASGVYAGLVTGISLRVPVPPSVLEYRSTRSGRSAWAMTRDERRRRARRRLRLTNARRHTQTEAAA